MSRGQKAVVVVAVLAVVIVVTHGPRAHLHEDWVEPELPPDLDSWLADGEAGVPGLRSGDQKEIVWLDPVAREPTPIALVYLHGFSADRHEMEPVVSILGQRLGANVYFARLAGHGQDGEALGKATAEEWLEDAVEALAIGERIGDRVAVIGTSTGGTLAAWLATRVESRRRLAALVLVSPNFHPKERTSRVLLYPWGVQVAELITGDERCFAPLNREQERHWTTCYPTRVLGTMMALVERVRTSDLSEIVVPTLVLYSPQDDVVDSRETESAIGRMTGTVPRLREVVTTSDPAHHVLAGDVVSGVSNDEALEMIESFVREALPAQRVDRR